MTKHHSFDTLIGALLDGDQSAAVAEATSLRDGGVDNERIITCVMPQVRQVVPLLRARGLTNIKVLAGGAALKQSSAKSLNVDYVADSIFDGVRYLESSTGQAS